MFDHKISLNNGRGVKFSTIAGICLLLCLSACAALEKGKTAGANPAQESAQPLQNFETIVVISTDTLTVSATEAVMPVYPLQQESEIKAVPEETESQQHKVHTVWLWQESRDCLWNIAKKYYNDPWQWKKIYLANKSQINDPRKIFPKQELIIPPADEPNEANSKH